MLKIQGKLVSFKAASGTNGVTRQLVIEFANDAVMDELAELIGSDEKLDITFVPQQPKLL